MSNDNNDDVQLPMRRVAGLWAWLPAFRAVAETENLRRAATFLALSPPALSRTLKLLEEAVGHVLFVREGRSLQLTVEGRTLLVAVRRAMRSIDEALGAAPDTLRLHAPVVLAPLVTRALVGLGRLSLATREAPLGELTTDLQRGALDLVLLAAHATGPLVCPVGVETVAMGDVPFMLSAAPSEGACRAVSLGPLDGWPLDRARAIAFETDDLAAALEAHRGGLALALPALLAPRDAGWGPSDAFRVVALRRSPLGPEPDRIAGVLDALTALMCSESEAHANAIG